MFFINEAKLANFAPDSTIYAAKKDVNELLRLLEKESKVVIKCFSDGNMIVKPKKFKAIIISRHNTESAKLRVLRAKTVLKYQRALRAYVLTCQRALRAYMLTCQRALRSYVLTCQRALRGYVLTCQCVLRAFVLMCQRALRAYVLMC